LSRRLSICDFSKSDLFTLLSAGKEREDRVNFDGPSNANDSSAAEAKIRDRSRIVDFIVVSNFNASNDVCLSP
jgi:hypothetical protein